MHQPSISHPLYVVQKYVKDIHEMGSIPGDFISYYTLQEEGAYQYSADPKRAMVFDSLIFAARVAAVEGAEIRVLTRREEAAEFREEIMDAS